MTTLPIAPALPVAPAPQRATVCSAFQMMWRFLFDKPARTRPSGAIPVQPLTRAQLLAADDATVWRLGHSTVLLKLHGRFWLTDPVFAERASPVSWAGPRRFHRPPLSIDELPPLAAVILSHDHYDHLDRAAIRRLDAKTEVFVTPLGVGDRLIGWGVASDKVRQLAWWQETTVGDVRLAATPARHFSGRGLFDRNRTLWASWALLSDDARVFFSGDSGYFDGFAQIGERYGPFDLTLIENGAYDVHWPGVHMQPEESLQAHLDLRGRWLLPIHNGSFDLALHAWSEPFERIYALAKAHGVKLTAPLIGEAVSLRAPQAAYPWWSAVDVAPSVAPTVEGVLATQTCK